MGIRDSLNGMIQHVPAPSRVPAIIRTAERRVPVPQHVVVPQADVIVTAAGAVGVRVIMNSAMMVMTAFLVF